MRRRLAVSASGANPRGWRSIRTRLVRIVLAAAVLASLAGAVLSARTLHVQPAGLLPTGTTGVVIADLSLSIGDDNLRDGRKALEKVMAANEPIGFVVFSDVPYELLPPGTPARELRPIMDLLAPVRGAVPNPWQQGYRAGTRISQSLELAASMLERDRISPGSILLLSDLDTAPDDFDKLARVLQDLKRAYTIRVVPLSPTSDGMRLFSGSLGPEAIVETDELNSAAPDPTTGVRGSTPAWLLLFGGICFAALALHEGFGTRLGLPRALRERSA